MRVALPWRVLARNQRVRRLVGEHRQLGVEQRHVDVRALASLLAPVKRGEDRDRGVHAGEQIGDRDPGAHRPAARLAVGQAGDAHQPAHALDDVIIAGAVGIGPVLAEAGDRREDQPRIGRAQRLGVEPELVQPPDLEILDHDVGFVGQLAHQRRAFGLAKSIAADFLPRLQLRK